MSGPARKEQARTVVGWLKTALFGDTSTLADLGTELAHDALEQHRRRREDPPVLTDPLRPEAARGAPRRGVASSPAVRPGPRRETPGDTVLNAGCEPARGDGPPAHASAQDSMRAELSRTILDALAPKGQGSARR